MSLKKNGKSFKQVVVLPLPDRCWFDNLTTCDQFHANNYEQIKVIVFSKNQGQ